MLAFNISLVLQNNLCEFTHPLIQEVSKESVLNAIFNDF